MSERDDNLEQAHHDPLRIVSQWCRLAAQQGYANDYQAPLHKKCFQHSCACACHKVN